MVGGIKMKNFFGTLAFGGVAISLIGCGGEDESTNVGIVDPGTQPTGVSSSLIVYMERNDFDEDRRAGSAPSMSMSPNAPAIEVSPNEVDVYSGGAVKGTREGLRITVDYSGINALDSLFLQVIGASEYFEFGAQENSQNSVEQLELVVGVDSNVGTGRFCMDISASDNQGAVSEPDQVCVDVDRGFLDYLEGEWKSDCISSGGRSDLIEWSVDLTDATHDITKFDGPNCTGTIEDQYTRQLNLGVQDESTSGSGGLVYEVNVVDFTESNAYFFCEIVPNSGYFDIRCTDAPDNLSLSEARFSLVSSDS